MTWKTNRQTIGFEHLWRWTSELSKHVINKFSLMDLSEFVPPLLNIGPEGELQREIKDVIDELDIMLHLTHQQKEVIKKFKKNVEHLIDPLGIWRNTSALPEIHETQGSKGEDPVVPKRRRDDFQWFRVCAEDLLCDVDDRIEELEELRKSAESTSESVRAILPTPSHQHSERCTYLTMMLILTSFVSQLDHLLGLKQQQASVV